MTIKNKSKKIYSDQKEIFFFLSSSLENSFLVVKISRVIIEITILLFKNLSFFSLFQSLFTMDHEYLK